MSDAQIFQVFSLIYLAVGIGMLINSTFYKKLYGDFIESSSSMYFGGVMALAIGYLIVTFHNTWVKDYSVIITVIGWIALIKGILILITPKVIIAISKAMIKALKVQAVLVIILGLLFSFLGFCPKSPLAAP